VDCCAALLHTPNVEHERLRLIVVFVTVVYENRVNWAGYTAAYNTKPAVSQHLGAVPVNAFPTGIEYVRNFVGLKRTMFGYYFYDLFVERWLLRPGDRLAEVQTAIELCYL
jgi:hypothetical protein